MLNSRYKADIAGGSLKIPESRIIADLLLNNVDAQGWKDAIEVQNVLQKRSIGTAKRQASLVRVRLETMDAELWEMVRDGSTIIATQCVFASSIKHSTLIGDFLDLVVREEFRMFGTNLSRQMWGKFLEGCHERDPHMPEWAESTANKLGDSVFRILDEVGYITDTKTMTLNHVRIANEVMTYLREHNEDYVLKCIQVAI
ncbi:DUF1819 family protein [Magnetovibrio blakemorei]|uniref:DUF1819 domain-containing protein n=1 Tax=Magnetovibrio blakemorei TaxID=28181 RepID=A0A1E5Q3Y9_9PROT|nr:DUF1819 family protein [Magnetovibrio blakemorei]OEJ64565.1 hypothetical protein BEN30_16180 [Magnetovibrio blakemorei]